MQDLKKEQSQQALPDTKNNYHLPALTGIRFFAIFHIFMFHLWALYWSPKPDEFSGMLSGFDNVPTILGAFLSNRLVDTQPFDRNAPRIVGTLSKPLSIPLNSSGLGDQCSAHR